MNWHQALPQVTDAEPEALERGSSLWTVPWPGQDCSGVYGGGGGGRGRRAQAWLLILLNSAGLEPLVTCQTDPHGSGDSGHSPLSFLPMTCADLIAVVLNDLDSRTQLRAGGTMETWALECI